MLEFHQTDLNLFVIFQRFARVAYKSRCYAPGHRTNMTTSVLYSSLFHDNANDSMVYDTPIAYHQDDRAALKHHPRTRSASAGLRPKKHSFLKADKNSTETVSIEEL